MKKNIFISIVLLTVVLLVVSFARPGVEFMIYQFPREMTPSIDGDFSEWALVPDSFYIGSDQLINTVFAEEVSEDIEVGNTIRFETTGLMQPSEPAQMNVVRFTKNE